MNLKGWYKTMKKEDFVKLGMDEELAAKCEAASLEELKGFIPKSRFDEVNNAKNTAQVTKYAHAHGVTVEAVGTRVHDATHTGGTKL